VLRCRSLAGEIDLLQDFRSLVSAFELATIEYAVVGALALAVHGFPRATTDIDLLIRSEDLEAALRAAATVGYRFPAEPMTFRNGMQVRRVTKVLAGDHLILDLLLVNDELEDVWTSRQRVASQHGGITVVSREALVKMKAMAGRAQDLVDLDRLRDEGGD
jgi:hypothetical protein